MLKKLLVIIILLGIGYGIYRLIDKQGATDLKNDTVEFVQDTFSSGAVSPLTGDIDEARPMDGSVVSGAIQDSGSLNIDTGTTIITEESLGDVSELQATPAKVQTPPTETTKPSTTSIKTNTTTTTVKKTTTPKPTIQKSSDLLHTLFQ